MAEGLKKKEKVIQIPVSLDTFLEFQETYYRYSATGKWRSREEFLKKLLENYKTKISLETYMVK